MKHGQRSDSGDRDIRAWLAGRLPSEWIEQPPEVVVDREEITVWVHVPEVDLGDEASEDVEAEAAAGRISGWREDTREQRMAIAREAQRRFDRTVSWGAIVGERRGLFTHLAVPVMTRLRQPQRQVLDTLVEAGVARSRADALQWCVRLVGKHEDDWLADLRAAMEKVRDVRDQGPA
jgi:hypothetical protein